MNSLFLIPISTFQLVSITYFTFLLTINPSSKSMPSKPSWFLFASRKPTFLELKKKPLLIIHGTLHNERYKMATYEYVNQHSSQRPIAMALALVSAVVLSPLYVNRRVEKHYEHGWSSSSFVLPFVLAGLIVAIKTTSSSSMQRRARNLMFSSPDEHSVLRIGSSSWGLAGILVMLMFVLSWQSSVQHFFWR